MPSLTESSDRAGFDEALADLVAASKVPAKQRNVRISTHLDIICTHAYENGLDPDSLSLLVDVVAQPNYIDQGSITTLIKSFYPATKVSSDVIFRVVGALGASKRKPSPSTQALLVRWLILVYEVLEDVSIISSLYAILFNLLDMISLRSPLCHLLSIITRRKHVRPFRIQMLLELCRDNDKEPALVGLLRVFKDYYPDVIIGDAVAGRASCFSHPDSEWRETMLAIQHARSRDHEERLHVQPSFRVVRRGAKRTRVSTVPEVRTAKASESSVTLEEIENVDDLVEKLEKIELPNQVISALGEPLLQKYLTVKPSEVASKRLDYWLSAFLDEELQSLQAGHKQNGALSDTLDKVLNYTRYTKVLPGPAESFLKTYVQWDILTTDRRTVLELLTYLPIRPFKDLQETFFTPLETALIDTTVESKLSLLSFYTALLRHWTAIILDVPYMTRSNTSESLSTTLTLLTRHVDLLALSILESSSANITTLSPILTFYEALAHTISHAPAYPQRFHITTPSEAVVYRLAFTSSLSTLSRLCSILSTYKSAFEATMSLSLPAGGPGAGPVYPRDYVNHFNGFLMDVCNCLWRNRGLNREDTNALGCLLPPPVAARLGLHADQLGYQLPTLFSISNGVALCAVSAACLRELEDAADVAAADGGEGGTVVPLSVRHEGPASQRSLTTLGNEGGLKISWGDYRLQVLRWLDERGVHGVRELMFNTMKHLMGNKSTGTR